MSMDIYLQLDGVTGESTRQNYSGWIELDSFSFGASNPVSIGTGSTGAGAGKVSLSSFNVMKRTDSSSPVLFQKCCMGQHFSKASIALNKAGGVASVKFLVYDFTEVFAESIQWSGGQGGDDTPAEAISFAFASINVTYTPQKVDGTPGSAVVAGWDVKANAKL
jgi:type VI secretion system secreted protein Hcp